MKNLRAYIYLTSGMFLAGASVVVGKMIIGVFPIFLSQAITLFISLIVIFPLAWLIEGNVFAFKLKKRDVLFIALQALTGMFLFRIFLLYGLKFTSAIDGGIITSTGPAILSLLSLFILKEQIKLKAWVGIAICVGGVLVINTVGASANTAATRLRYVGNFLVLLAVVGEALFTIFRKKLSFTDKPITSTMIIITFSFVMFLPVSIYQSVSFNFASVTLLDFIPLAIYSVLCTVLAYICWFAGVAKVKVSVASGFMGVMPVASVLLSFLVLGEQIKWQHILGTALVIVGIYTIAFIKAKPKV